MEKITADALNKLLDNPDDLENKFPTLKKYKILSNKILSEVLFLNDKHIDYQITFENCSFDQLNMEDVIARDVLFVNCKFSQDFKIYSLRAMILTFENCQFEKSLIIENCKLTFLNFFKVDSINGININAGDVNFLKINPISEKTHFTFKGKFLHIKDLSLTSVSGITMFAKSCIINKISLSGYYNVNSRLNFIDVLNIQVDLNEINNDGKIYFSNLKPVSVLEFNSKPISDYIEEFTRSKETTSTTYELEYLTSLDQKMNVVDLIRSNSPLYDFPIFIEENFYAGLLVHLNAGSLMFTIKNSSAGVLELKNIMLEKYDLELKNSDLSSIKLINSKIPNIQFKDDYLNYYNIYNDLYTSANKQNNTKDKVEYYTISQKFLYMHLKYEVNSPRDIGSIITILVSEIYSNHGTNWLKAIFVTVVISITFFCLFVGNIDGIYWNSSQNGINYFIDNLLPYFPQFLNPLHKIEFMEDIGKLGVWSGLIDILSRLVISIGLFEIIRSFRKHVRQ